EIWINITVNFLVVIFLLVGTFFILSSSIVVIRFPDVYTRLHAATKASTLGIFTLLIATFCYLYVAHDVINCKLLLAILFILLTNQVASHMLSRAAHKNGIKPLLKHREDMYEKELDEHHH